MPYTQADLDELRAEIKKVRLVESTQFGDQATKFRSLDELLKLEAQMAKEVSVNNRVRFGATSKGL